jgi:hypothetical protein
VRALDAQVIEQPKGVPRHVLEQVGHPRGQARHQPHDVRDRRRDLGGQPGVAVVEADHVEAAPREQLAQVAVPVDQLHPETHHEQERRVRRVADRLVDELELAGLGALFGHRPGRSRRVFAIRTENLKLLVRRNLGSRPSSSSFAVCPLAKRHPFPNSWNRIGPRWLSRSL